MKTFALLFAWIPVGLAFMAGGDDFGGYVIWTLLLLCLGIEVCAAAFWAASEDSLARIKIDMVLALSRSENLDEQHQRVTALRLFIERGTA